MRPIDADALKDAMYTETMLKDTDMQRWDSGCWIRYKLFENVLREQPTIDAEPRWIPVTERLPRERLLILISCAVPYDDRYDHVTAGCYLNETWIEMDGFRTLKDVHAWMPLPKPYKAIPPVAEGSK